MSETIVQNYTLAELDNIARATIVYWPDIHPAVRAICGAYLALREQTAWTDQEEKTPDLETPSGEPSWYRCSEIVLCGWKVGHAGWETVKGYLETDFNGRLQWKDESECLIHPTHWKPMPEAPGKPQPSVIEDTVAIMEILAPDAQQGNPPCPKCLENKNVESIENDGYYCWKDGCGGFKVEA